MSDEMVTVPVQMTRAEVEERATAELFHDPVGIACRRWLADNPEQEQEREVFRLDHYDDMGYRIVRRAVPVEALRPGDRVAGRVVESAVSRYVVWTDHGYEPSEYAPGTIVLLDPEDGER